MVSERLKQLAVPNANLAVPDSGPDGHRHHTHEVNGGLSRGCCSSRPGNRVRLPGKDLAVRPHLNRSQGLMSWRKQRQNLNPRSLSCLAQCFHCAELLPNSLGKARTVILKKTGYTEIFSCGLAQTSFPQLSRSVISLRGALAKFPGEGQDRDLKEDRLHRDLQLRSGTILVPSVVSLSVFIARSSCQIPWGRPGP